MFRIFFKHGWGRGGGGIGWSCCRILHVRTISIRLLLHTWHYLTPWDAHRNGRTASITSDTRNFVYCMFCTYRTTVHSSAINVPVATPRRLANREPYTITFQTRFASCYIHTACRLKHPLLRGLAVLIHPSLTSYYYDTVAHDTLSHICK